MFHKSRIHNEMRQGRLALLQTSYFDAAKYVVCVMFCVCVCGCERSLTMTMKPIDCIGLKQMDGLLDCVVD